MASFVFTVLGPDRPGLVDDIAAVVHARGGSWQRSHMARLGGRFAGIVEVELPEGAIDDLRRELSGIGDLEVVVGDGQCDAAGTRVEVSLTGTDRPGLVRSVTAALVEVGANIEELTSSTTSAPMSGEPLFQATVVASLPAQVRLADVRQRLEELADRLLVDIALT